MSRCYYDRHNEVHVNAEGNECLRDEYGDPTHHCAARLGCGQHVGPDELTCARCIGRTRADLRRLADLSALALPAAVESGGVDSEAANLAGPAADPRGWSERRIAMMSHLDTWSTLGYRDGDTRRVITEEQHAHALAAMPEDDDRHPLNVLGRWELMLREDYDQPATARITVTAAAAYLERQLPRIAQDDEQDFPLFAREVRKCRKHLESVLATLVRPERGAPCPECTSDETGVGPRLVRHFGHWCEDEDCCKVHYDDDSGDVWRCPRDRSHEWPHHDYERWVEERKANGRIGA